MWQVLGLGPQFADVALRNIPGFFGNDPGAGGVGGGGGNLLNDILGGDILGGFGDILGDIAGNFGDIFADIGGGLGDFIGGGLGA